MEKAKGPAEEPQSAADGKQAADKTRSIGETVLTVLVSMILLAGLAFFLWREGIIPGKRDAAPPPAEEAAPVSTPDPPGTTSAPSPASADWVEGDWDWELENGVLTVSGRGNTAAYGELDEQPWTAQREQITRVVIEEGITGIGDYAFRYLPEMCAVEIPDSVTVIGDVAFANCISLSEVRIPEGVTSIGYAAFYNCASLHTLRIPAAVSYIGEDAFSYCGNLSALEADPGNPRFCSIDGVLFTKDGLTLLCCPAGIGTDEYTIPAGVTAIGACAFQGCGGLVAVRIPDSVTAIGGAAFLDCRSLQGIRIPAGVTRIDGEAFRFCDHLIAVEMAEGVTTIGEFAFAYCGRLTEVRIPASVTKIEEGAFVGCTDLTEIFYSGRSEQWAVLSVDDGNKALGLARLHFGGE